MAHDRHSILQEYPKEITHILKATTSDPKDETARLKVATTLARALSFAKRRTGEDRAPQDAEVYKLAAVIRQARSAEQFDQLLKEALPKARSAILEKYDLAWKLPWSPEKETGQKKERARRARKADVSEAPVPDLTARIDSLEKAISRIDNQLSDLQAMIESSGPKKLARQLDEVLQKLKTHQHDREDGKAYILEKREL